MDSSEWQLIEDAPRDGTVILVYWYEKSTREHEFHTAKTTTTGHLYGFGSPYHINYTKATRWQYLPTAPEKSA